MIQRMPPQSLKATCLTATRCPDKYRPRDQRWSALLSNSCWEVIIHQGPTPMELSSDELPRSQSRSVLLGSNDRKDKIPGAKANLCCCSRMSRRMPPQRPRPNCLFRKNDPKYAIPAGKAHCRDMRSQSSPFQGATKLFCWTCANNIKRSTENSGGGILACI